MVFPTIEFAAFFLVVLTLNWLLMPHPALWKPFVLGASYFFYGYADWRFVVLLAAVTVVNQAAAMALAATDDDRRRRLLLTAAVVADLGLLAWFKYFGFFVVSVNEALDSVGLGAPLPLLRIALPVGISFFTFQAISYVVDVHQRVLRPAKPVDFAIFQAFFPHLVAGPIVRAREFLPQLARPRDPRRVPAGPALLLIAGGLVKKILVADFLATRIVDPVFGSPGAHSALEVLVAVYAYAVQIYCDFSGYTDMAIGLALLMGFRFPRNFDQPYRATSLQDFWRRWHMTLSRWLRDYLYVPLGGSRGSRLLTYRNLLLTMLLGGLWHGAAWTFVIWGAIHGVGLALERWWRERRAAGEPSDPPTSEPALVGARRPDGPAAAARLPAPRAPATRPASTRPARPGAPLPAPRPLQRVGAPLLAGLLTFHVVCAAWVFFRAPDLGTAGTVFARLLHPGPAPLVTPAVLCAVAVGLALHLLPSRTWDLVQQRFGRLRVVTQAALLAALIVLVNVLVGGQGVAPFLYFQF